MGEIMILSAGSAQVAENLTHATTGEGLPEAGGHAMTTGSAEGAGHHADPSLFGVMDGTVWVSVAMIVFLAIVVAKGGVRAIGGMLDRQIAEIRKQLDDAKALRAEAEALRDDYAKRIADAERSAADMAAHAEAEAQAVIEQARRDAAELVERRGRMAQDKIAAAERAAIAEVRARTAAAASDAAAALIAERHGVEADRGLIDRMIAQLGRPH